MSIGLGATIGAVSSGSVIVAVHRGSDGARTVLAASHCHVERSGETGPCDRHRPFTGRICDSLRVASYCTTVVAGCHRPAFNDPFSVLLGRSGREMGLEQRNLRPTIVVCDFEPSCRQTGTACVSAVVSSTM